MTLAGQSGTLGGGSVSTDNSGNYSFAILAGGSYLVTPALSSDTFSPSSQTFNNMSANQTQNFVATIAGSATISGQVTLSGNGLGGVTMTLSSSLASPATTTTDGSGNYSFSALAGGNYTVTPSLGSDTFNPPSQASAT